MYKINSEGYYDVFMDQDYVCASWDLVQSALKRQCDVIQMPNGNVVITEQKVEVSTYEWDPKIGQMMKVNTEDQE